MPEAQGIPGFQVCGVCVLLCSPGVVWMYVQVSVCLCEVCSCISLSSVSFCAPGCVLCVTTTTKIFWCGFVFVLCPCVGVECLEHVKVWLCEHACVGVSA